MANFSPGFIYPRGAPLTVELVYTNYGANGQTYSLLNVPIGAAKADREIFLLTSSSGLNPNISIGGNIAGLTTSVGPKSNLVNSTYYMNYNSMYATVPTGTTCNISIVYSSTLYRPAFSVYRVTGRQTLGASFYDHASNYAASGTTVNVSGIDVEAGGVAISLWRSDINGATLSSFSSPSLSFSTDLLTPYYYVSGSPYYYTAYGHTSVVGSAVTGTTMTATASASGLHSAGVFTFK